MNLDTVMALHEAKVDTEGALRRFGGNSELYERFLLKFLSDENYSKIAPALARGDLEAAQHAAHTLKGVSANLGMTRLYEACSEIVNDLRAGDPQSAQAHCAALNAAYQEVSSVLLLEQRRRQDPAH